MKRLVQKKLLNELSKAILKGTVSNNQKIKVDEVDGVIFFQNMETENQDQNEEVIEDAEIIEES